MKKPVVRYAAAIGLILLGAGYLLYSSMGSSIVYYYTVDEVLSSDSGFSGRGVRISGRVQPGSVDLSHDGKGLFFNAFSEESGAAMRVFYDGVVPDTFKEGSEVVVEGIWDNGRNEFEAEVLLSKCPSKYEGKAETHPEDVAMENAGPSI